MTAKPNDGDPPQRINDYLMTINASAAGGLLITVHCSLITVH
ncbi:MAG TPA: hypothetical protein PLT92_14865 [Ignavibacteriaceae bacterium]|nr:hypothetical protein [Ignavibacteriaceae bacterium]